ncbi:hypothetical protein Ddye_006851 [Dipteronia dyeriana]|uniref:EF-hand domain-containing protein n=1 Tax=Dipteronia dyeriana TaxID=168575 RepID=A0AAD9XJ68_9ROSI|nr:hypothetical protein Ddye_006851 [Dipteronia dyeriana]
MKDQNNPLAIKNGDNNFPMTCAWTNYRRLKMTLPQIHLKDFFRRFDKDEDRRLSKQELKNAFNSLGSRCPTWRATRALQHADANGNGYISDQELDGLVKYAAKHGYDDKK